MRTNNFNNREIPKDLSNKWQNIVDFIVELIDIPVALIMRLDKTYMEVYKTNDQLNNPYSVDHREKIDGQFCYEVIKNNDMLIVENALEDSKWKESSDVKFGIKSFLGYPINWPDGNNFGAICVLDFEERKFNKETIALLKEFKELIESHLLIINQNYLLQKEIEEKEKLKNKFDTTLKSIGDAIITTDLEGKILMLNPTAEKLTGWKEAEAKGKNLEKVFKIISSKTEEKLKNPVKKVLEEKVVIELANDTTLITKEGKRRQILNTATIIEHDNGEVEGVIIVFTDVTEKYMNIEKLQRTKDRYQELAESINAILWEYDIKKDNWDYIAPQVESILGYKPNEWTNFQFWIDNIHPEDRTWVKDYCLTCALEGQDHMLEYRSYHKNGDIVWLKDHISVEMKNGEPIKLRGLMTNITDLKMIEEKIKIENKWLESLFKNSTDAMLMFDKNECIINVNQAFIEKFRYQLDEIIGLKVDDVINMGKINSADIRATKNILKGQSIELEEIRYDKYENPYMFKIKGIPVVLKDETVGGYAIYSDISERKLREEKIKYLSMHDHLTGLYNRNFLGEEINRLDVKRNLPIAVVMVDLNGLKIINDTYGHQKGDELLVKTSGILKDVFRENDIITRWGGDEFIIFLPKTGREDAENILSRIKENNQSVNVGDHEILPVSLAVGLALKENESEDIYELFQKAENQMYKDKLLQENSMKSHITNTLLKTLQQKSEETENHVMRMSELAKAIGKKIDLSMSDQDKLTLLATLHDIGKTIISKDILSKPGELDAKEWEEIKKHPETGYRICSASQEFSHIALEVLFHHEHWDGSGYPRGLKGEEIPLLARILSIVDAYDVMTNGRFYKKSVNKAEALLELQKCAGSHFDPKLTEIFINIMR